MRRLGGSAAGGLKNRHRGLPNGNRSCVKPLTGEGSAVPARKPRHVRVTIRGLVRGRRGWVTSKRCVRVRCRALPMRAPRRAPSRWLQTEWQGPKYAVRSVGVSECPRCAGWYPPAAVQADGLHAVGAALRRALPSVFSTRIGESVLRLLLDVLNNLNRITGIGGVGID